MNSDKSLPGRTDRDIAGCFNAHFARHHKVRLLGGAREPLYQPPSGTRPALIHYTRDYARSALHELAHWCLAGQQRRNCVDYGYWYVPPPRSAAVQQAFQLAEARVQSLELLLAEAVDVPFEVSIDDPANFIAAKTAFAAVVARRAADCRRAGLPSRAGELLALFRRRFAAEATWR